MPNKGRTNTQSAINMMRNDGFSTAGGDRTAVDNIAILVTDGYSNVNRKDTIPEAMAAKQLGVAMYVVAIGDQVDMTEVNSMAGTSSNGGPSSYVFRVRNDNDLENTAQELTNKLCNWLVDDWA